MDTQIGRKRREIKRQREKCHFIIVERREMMTPLMGERRRIKEQRREGETRWERAELKMERKDRARGSEERKGKSQREREEKVLPRNHAPRSPTDFYVRTEDREGETHGMPECGPRLRRETYRSFSPLLSFSRPLSFFLNQGRNAHEHIHIRT